MRFQFFTGESLASDHVTEATKSMRDPQIKDLISTSLDPTTASSDQFKLTPHKILWDYWQDLRGDASIARYEFIDPAKFCKAMGYVLLLEPNADGTDFKYRVYGSVVAQRYGREMTGKWLSEFMGGTKILSLHQYPAILKTKCPFYSEHISLTTAYTKTIWCRIALPMENKTGIIDRILVGNVPVDKDIIQK